MEIKNLKSIISECILYADDISSNPEVYPEGSKMPLKDLLRYDMLMFLGYLYDPEAEVIADQVEYIRVNLRMVISEEKFVEFVDNKCNDPDFLSMQPRSLIFFINIDKQNSESPPHILALNLSYLNVDRSTSVLPVAISCAS